MLKLVIAKKKSYLHVGPQNRAQSKVVNRYENIPGDLNFDLSAPDQKHNSHFLVLTYTYDLTT